ARRTRHGTDVRRWHHRAKAQGAVRERARVRDDLARRSDRTDRRDCRDHLMQIARDRLCERDAIDRARRRRLVQTWKRDEYAGSAAGRHEMLGNAELLRWADVAEG